MATEKNAAIYLTNEQVEEMRSSGILGSETTVSLQGTLFYYFTLCFGFRGQDEAVKLHWGDVDLVEKFDGDGNLEECYLEFLERDTKTRTGEGSSTRAFAPKIFPLADKTR